MPTTEKPGLTRDAIKYLAIFTMLLNHIANVLLPENTILWEVLVDIGYFTAITMCYFLVEGFYYTHSRRKYGERLLIFAGISQVPYTMAFGYSQLNMIFTLFICFMILVIQEKMMASPWRIPLLILLLLLSVFSDWAILAPVFTIWFYAGWGNRKRMIILNFYNGKKSEKAPKFSKWFFYIFYPAHLLILSIVRIIVQ